MSKRSQGNRQTLPSRPMAAASVGGARHDDDDSAGSTEGAMVARRNPSSGNDNDENSPERVATRRSTCSNITVPVRRSRRSRLSRKTVALSVKSEIAAMIIVKMKFNSGVYDIKI